MRKLILRCNLSPGDIVMLTAAVRDLHFWRPGEYHTDVRTSSAALWENSPHITPLSEADPEVRVLDCSYPLIDHANQRPYHCLHGFIEFLNDSLGVSLRPTAFKGDIHLSAQEKAWHSQVRELTGDDTPFWIVAAGGKHDVTIKWWETGRYQAVIDHFRGRIQFVQVGAVGHHHPRLEGVIDLRGKTTLRELVRLVYHAQGVLCPVTALMHLAAAVETPPGRPPRRACVVVAGGREPAHWEAYPDHQFIHTNGSLPCCQDGGCWRDRTEPLRDGDERDRPEHRCVAVSRRLPRCLDLITPAVVIDRIETYFKAGALGYLSRRGAAAAARGVQATARNTYDHQTLTLHSAGLACDAVVRTLGECPARYEGRGIVIAGGGVRYFTCAWVCIQMLRRLGCRLPVELWYLGEREMDNERRALLTGAGVACVDACAVRKRHPVRTLGGWELKPYAILHSVFREVLFLDADNVPVVDPSFLFETPEFRRRGAVFWPDYDFGTQAKAAPIWKSCGLRQPDEPEFESGQMLFDKQRCWPALRLALWFNENSDFYYRYIHGDKETFHLAFRKLKQPYALVPHPIHPLTGTMCQHDFDGRRIFQHRNQDKWDLLLHNRRVPGFKFEAACRGYLVQLRRRWDGGLNSIGPRGCAAGEGARNLRFAAIVITRANGKHQPGGTLKHLARTDWAGAVSEFRMENESDASPDQADAPEVSEARGVYQALKQGLQGNADYTLFLQDDLELNQFLGHNLRAWKPLRQGRVTLGGLCNTRVRELACDVANNARIADPRFGFAAGGWLVSRVTLEHLVKHWNRANGVHASRMVRLAARLRQPLYLHAPSLVQYVKREGRYPKLAVDFDPTWKA